MKRVLKAGTEPEALTDYKDRFAAAPRAPTWGEFKKTPAKREVQKQLLVDQRGLCAYCENALIPPDQSVEHFISRHTDHSRELDWTNLLLCCAGGERPLPEDIEDRDVRHDPHGSRTCGHAKLRCGDTILSPLSIPHTPRLFRFKSETGEIEPDVVECERAGIQTELAYETIRVLGLRTKRLNDARLVLITELTEELGKDGQTGPFTLDREREMAGMYLPQAGSLPAFFTTVRFTLGAGAEVHLAAIGFQG